MRSRKKCYKPKWLWQRKWIGRRPQLGASQCLFKNSFSLSEKKNPKLVFHLKNTFVVTVNKNPSLRIHVNKENDHAGNTTKHQKI